MSCSTDRGSGPKPCPARNFNVNAETNTRGLTPEDDKRIAAMWNETPRPTQKEMAARIGCSRQAIQYSLERSGLPTAGRKKALLPEEQREALAARVRLGATIQSLAEELGMDRDELAGTLRAHRRRGESKTPECEARENLRGKGGQRTCLGPGCGKSFLSWDRAKNRLCPSCSSGQSVTLYRVAAARRH